MVFAPLLSLLAAHLQWVPAAPSLTYVAGSTVKVSQVDGDFDYGLAQSFANPVEIVPTLSLTQTISNVAGNDLGSSFEANGHLYFLFGDTISGTPGLDYHAGDTMAWSDSRDPYDLVIHYLMNTSTKPLFITPPGVEMGPDDTPNCGICIGGTIYVIVNSGTNPMTHDRTGNFSVLTTFDPGAQKFHTGRTVSSLNPNLPVNDPRQGHFIFNSLQPYGAFTAMFGSGEFRQSDIYLSMTPSALLPWGAGTLYYAGQVRGFPIWSGSESDAVPIVTDDPLGNQPAWPNDTPTVGHSSVIYDNNSHLWLMTFDGGRQDGPLRNSTVGIYFTSAPQQWGPWAKPQLIFNAVRDHASGNYLSNYDRVNTPNVPGVPAGPTIGLNDPNATRGDLYAPELIGRFTKLTMTPQGPMLSIFYLTSTWNPYTPVEMRSDFLLSPQ